jgi:hypothetical protein
MPRVRISATFGVSIERLAKAYALEHDMSFSQAVEELATDSGRLWWFKQTKKKRAELMEQVGEIKLKP